MTIKPITFSAPMVRALIGGRKTRTRRPLCAHGDIEKPRFAVGDFLWVREAFQLYPEYDHLPPATAVVEGDIRPHDWSIYYNSDNPDWFWESRKRNASFMPRALSRITLEVTGVRVERLQHISEADAMSEGIGIDAATGCFHVEPGGFKSGSAVSVFRELWNSLYTAPKDEWKRWKANPWVAAYEFKVHLQNVDEVVR